MSNIYFKIEVNILSFVITEYKRHMDGVDLLDSLIGRNEIEICSKKWYIRLYYNFTDLTVVNSWLLYKR